MTESTDNLLSHISFSSHVDHYKEFLVSNYWTLSITREPIAAYYPGEDFIKLRIQSITGIQEPEATMLDFTVRGYASYQTGQTSVPVSDLSLTFVDYEDASILYWARSWRDAQHYWENFTANRLEYCVMEGCIYRCNKEGRAVRKYILKRTLFNRLNYPDDFSEDSNLIGYNVSVEVRTILRSEILNWDSSAA